MFFTTPCVREYVTPSILNSLARAAATWYNHEMCSGSSVSIFLSTRVSALNKAHYERKRRYLHEPLAILVRRPTLCSALVAEGCLQWYISGMPLACLTCRENTHSRR